VLSNPNFRLPSLKDEMFEPIYLTMSDEEFEELLDIVDLVFGEEMIDDVVLYLLKVEMGIS
jgi:hypothetical protein